MLLFGCLATFQRVHITLVGEELKFPLHSWIFTVYFVIVVSVRFCGGRSMDDVSRMDDVERLYQCFKLGISPPQSALKESKKSLKNSKKRSSIQREGSSLSPLSSGSPGQRQQSPATNQLSTDKLRTEEIKSAKATGRKPISAALFYGSPHGVPPKRPRRLLQLLREIREDLCKDNKLGSRKEIWVTFPKQDQAMNFAKDYSYTRLFSYQNHITGQRRFLVSTYTELWKRYKNMDSRFRHHYEVIQEGLPCHLYFDLEYNKKVNVGKNGDEMVDILISATFDVLREKYSIEGKDDWVVELDSSTEEKFSRHLIIHVSGAAFKDNSHAGAFVAEICSRISIARGSDRRFDKLFISKESSSQETPCQLFVDTAVYSRNRCFRLALSSKAGKDSFLFPTRRFRCKNMCEEEMFMDSLICKMDDDCHKLLICKMDRDCMKKLYFDSETNYSKGQCFDAPAFAFPVSSSVMENTYFVGKSPFPALDAFVECIASTGNVPGKIRSWYLFSEHGLMIYSMSNNRYCERIGRQHKSNNVMYIVDFQRVLCYQKCYDPECKGYKSPFRPIPEDVIPDTMEFFSLTQTDHCKVGTNLIDSPFNHNNDPPSNDSCKQDDWWLTAIKVADDVESTTLSLAHGESKISEQRMDDEDDDEWWMAVEITASEAEQCVKR